MLNSIRSSIVVLFLVAFSSAAVAATTVPYTFTAGTAAKASEVNANFQAVATAIDNLAARVTKLEGQFTAADLAGTYSMTALNVGITDGGTPGTAGGTVGTAIFVATVTLSANLTGTITNNSEAGGLLAITQSGITITNATIPNQSITWSLSGSSISMLGGTFSVVSGGRLLVGSENKHPSATDVQNTLMLLTRTN